MMKQVYTPNVGLKGLHYAGLCLQWVDDAGSSPKRSDTAKIAYQNEANVGRIRLSQLPDGVWVPVFFSFSKGSFTYPSGNTVYFKDAWHVALARRTGNTMQIYDSEVARGAKQPYPALEAVEAWFAVYGAKYVGWSTHCDGREYAKEEDMRKMTRNELMWNYRMLSGGEPSEKEVDSWMKAIENGAEYDYVNEEMKRYYSDSGRGFPQYKKSSEDKIKKLEQRIKELEASNSGEFIKVSDLYIKK